MPINSKLKIFSGSANRRLSEEIAGCIGVPLGQSEVTRFSDGEISINIKESVRGSNAVSYTHLETMGPAWKYVLQEKQLGTGHAVVRALPELPDSGNLLVLCGDTPLLETRH